MRSLLLLTMIHLLCTIKEARREDKEAAGSGSCDDSKEVWRLASSEPGQKTGIDLVVNVAHAERR